ncbi:hypothetical protein D3C71_2241160 [compost metagenome]
MVPLLPIYGRLSAGIESTITAQESETASSTAVQAASTPVFFFQLPFAAIR